MKSVIISAVLMSTVAFAAAPTNLKINCQSKDIGKIEITLSESNSFGSDEMFYYKINSNRYDRQSEESLGSDEYPINVHSNDYMARLSTNESVHLYPEQTLQIKIPAYGVNWNKFAKKCYVQAPSFGFDLTLGVESNKVYQDHSKAYVRTYQTNPEVSTIMVPGAPFSHPQEVLNGKDCPDINQWRLADEIVCNVVNTDN